MYLEYKKEIIPKALFLETMIPQDMVDGLNDLLDKVSDDKKYKFNHNAAPTLAGVIKKGFQLYLEQEEPIIKEYTDLTHELSKKYIQEFSILSQNNYSDKVIKTEDIWSVHQYEGDYNPIHCHNVPNQAPGFATVLWTKVPKQLETISPDREMYETKGFIRDFDLNGITDGHLCFMTDPTTSIDEIERFKFSGTSLVQPVVGKLVLFPLHINHLVYPFEGEGERRSIASNISCVGI
tara:strand:- start:335 stop:1042 length:708 start_codon:yes stop_codon:yes gene_type:complete